MICVFINMTGTPEGSTESGFMEKPGIEPATPGLQGIAHIHYTTAAQDIAVELNKNVQREITGNTTQYYQNTTKGFEFTDANFKIKAV